MLDFLTELVKLLAQLAVLATAAIGLSTAREQRSREKKKSHRR